MAWNPKNLWKQPDDVKSRSETGVHSRTISFKGKATDIDVAVSLIVEGEIIETGWAYASHTVRAVPGGMAILSLNCVEAAAPHPGEDEGEGSQDELQPLKDRWLIRSVRNDVSVMAYCGPSFGSNPQRALVEAWMKEPDGELAEQYQFKKSDGSIYEISEPPTLELIKKIQKGVEAVIRFYPVITRIRTYAAVPPACLENIGFIDTPPAPAGTAKSPSGLSAAVDAHQWLKVQDDAEELEDGKWTRTESWMGIAKSENAENSPWDPDLYGKERWSMPYQQ
jgi:hypothetical protein